MPDCTTHPDATHVRDLYDRLLQGWNARSGAAFAAPFSRVASFVALDGTRFRGAAQVARVHQDLFDTHLRGTRLVGRVTSLRFLGNDVAVLVADGDTILTDKRAPSPERSSHQTLVAARRGGRWRIEAFQNTRIRPMSRSPAATLLWVITDWLWRLLGSQAPQQESPTP